MDIFFVISGFLITSIILDDLARKEFSFIKFYERRARRILPALMLVVLCCLPFAWFWLLPEDMKDFSQSLLGVATFLSNVVFWSETGYFDTAAELKPLLHTWSLAIEEQYYIIFPVVMIVIFRFGYKVTAACLALMFVASLAASEWTAYNAPSAGFYLLPTRGWELLIGSFCALYLHNRGRGSRRSKSAILAETAGLLMILASIFFYTNETPHPSAYTLVPTIGAALIILFSRRGSPVQRLLGSRLLAGIGLISYSLYLWHFPVFAFYRYRMSQEPVDGPWPLMIAAIVMLSYLSWKFVERPFRNRNTVSRPVIFGFSAVSLVAIAAVGVGGQLTWGYHPYRPMMQQVVIDLPTVRTTHCFNEGRRSIDEIEAGDICTVGGEEIHAAIIGDSHAGALLDALDDLGVTDDRGFWTFSEAYCPPALGFVLNRYGNQCGPKREVSFEKILQNESIRDVVLVLNWGIYTQGWRDKLVPSAATLNGVRSADISENPELLETALTQSIEKLNSEGKNVIILGPGPEFTSRVHDYVEKVRLFGQPVDRNEMAVTREEFEKRNAEAFAILAGIDSADVVPVHDLFCDSTMCRALDGKGRPLFSDTNHVNKDGADLVAELIYESLIDANLQEPAD